jgi:parallel beta-helix repeat protein
MAVMIGHPMFKVDTDSGTIEWYNELGSEYQLLKTVATKIVAADGTGDYDNIQSGINALPVGGGVVYIKEGSYVIGSPISLGDNISLFGAGKSTKLMAADNYKSEFIKASNNDGVHIKDLYISGAGFGLGYTGHRGISFTDVDNSSVDNCWFTNLRDCVYNAGSVDDIRVNANIFDTNLRGIVVLNDDDNMIISNNHLKNNTLGIVTAKSNNSLIYGNQLVDNSRGISVIGSRVDVFGNRISSNGSGIDICVQNGIVSNNIINCPVGMVIGDFGLMYNTSFTLITNNNISGSTEAIRIGSGTSQQNMISNNYLIGSFIDSGTGTIINHNSKEPD